MVLDKCVFSDAQSMTSSGTEYSTNVIDTEVAASNIGAGTPIWLVCRVNTEFSGTSGTYYAQLLNCATSGGTYTVALQGLSVTTGLLAKGYDLLTTPLPVETLRYLKIGYVQGTGSGYTAGKIDAFLTLNAPRN